MPSRLFFVICLLLLPGLHTASSQPHRHLEQSHDLTNYDSLSAWLNRAQWISEHIHISTGLWPMPEKTPLNPIESDISDESGYRVQTITLETYPDFYLTGTLFLPPGTGPFPAILSPHGHWSEGRFENIDRASIPGRALNLAKRGFAVFSYSMIGYNENSGLFPHKFDAPQYQLWGFSSMGLQLWNSIRALDYISTHPDVDSNRIGMTGASGGATQTFMLTAIDDRIRAAAPVNMISAHFQGGCICENAPLLRHGINNVEIAALAAPRPLLIVSTSGDWTVNTPNKEFPAIQKIYALLEAQAHVENVHFNYPHNYNQDTRESVYSWFAKQFGTGSQSSHELPFDLPPSATQHAKLPLQPISEDDLFQDFTSRAAHQISPNPPATPEALVNYMNTFAIAMNHILYTDSLPSTSLSISHPISEETSTAVLIVHEANQYSYNKAQSLFNDHLKTGHAAALLPLDSALVPPDSIRYWTTYNPTHHQTQVHHIMSAAFTLLESPGVETIHLIGLDSAGPVTLLARTGIPSVEHTQIDFNGINFESDNDFLAYANIPLIRRAGGFKTAVAKLFLQPLTIQNLPNGELKTWIRELYNELGAADMLSFE